MEKRIERIFLEYYSTEGLSPVDVVSEALCYKLRVNVGALHYPLSFDFDRVVVEYSDLSKKLYEKVCKEKSELIQETYKKFKEVYTASFMQNLYCEIEANLLECKSKREKELYIYSLLYPFDYIVKLCFPGSIQEFENCYAKLEWNDIDVELSIKNKWRDYFIAHKLLSTSPKEIEDSIFWVPFVVWRNAAFNFLNSVKKISVLQDIDISKLKKKYNLLGGYEFSYTIQEKMLLNLSIEGTDTSLPRELDTDKAKELLNRGVTAGFLDNTFRPIKGKMTRAQQKEFALCISIECDFKNYCKIFEPFWGIKNLAQSSTLNEGSIEKIRELFDEETQKKVKIKSK